MGHNVLGAAARWCRLPPAEGTAADALPSTAPATPLPSNTPHQILAWSLNFGACFGGNGTLIGASANIVTATLAERAGEHITFLQWLKAGIPVTIVSQRGTALVLPFGTALWHAWFSFRRLLFAVYLLHAVHMRPVTSTLAMLGRSAAQPADAPLCPLPPLPTWTQLSVAMADLWLILRFCL